jgi:hypothetical protein
MRGAVAFGVSGAHSCVFGAEPSQRFVSGTQRFVSGTHICAFGAEPSRHLEIPIYAREHQRQLAFLIRACDGRATGTQRSRLLEIVVAHLPYREAITAHESHPTGTPNLASSRSSSHTASVRSTSTFHASSEVISGHQRSSVVIRGHQRSSEVVFAYRFGEVDFHIPRLISLFRIFAQGRDALERRDERVDGQAVYG